MKANRNNKMKNISLLVASTPAGLDFTNLFLGYALLLHSDCSCPRHMFTILTGVFSYSLELNFMWPITNNMLCYLFLENVMLPLLSCIDRC